MISSVERECVPRTIYEGGSLIFFFARGGSQGNKKNEHGGFSASKPAYVLGMKRSWNGRRKRAKSVWFLSHSCQAGQRATSISSSATLFLSLSSHKQGTHDDGGYRDACVLSTMKSRNGWMDGQVNKRARCVREKYNRRSLTQPNCLISLVYSQKCTVLCRERLPDSCPPVIPRGTTFFFRTSTETIQHHCDASYTNV